MLLGFRALEEQLRLKLEVATVDHALRPDSGKDAAYVRRLCSRLGVPCHLLKVSVGREGGTEAAARRARYQALVKIARRRGLSRIVTAHTMEDQVETVLMRLARGSGVRGLRGILARRGPVVRPMLEVSRAEVAGFLSQRRVKPRQDPTNHLDIYARNRVRMQVLPALVRALGEQSLRSIARSASIATEDEVLLDRLAKRRAGRLLTEEPDGHLSGNCAKVAALPRALRRRVLRWATRRMGARLDAEHARRLEAALLSRKPTYATLPGGIDFLARYGRFELRRNRQERHLSASTRSRVSVYRRGGWGERHAPFERVLPGPGRFRFPEGEVEVREVVRAGKAPQGAIRISLEQVRLPLLLRSRRPGDRFRPRAGHLKKLKSFLIDQKVPRERRDALVLLADSRGRILWIPGRWESDAASEGEQARHAWQIRVRPSVQLLGQL
jgi:tRNA(Ile)-lysidine synthase